MPLWMKERGECAFRRLSRRCGTVYNWLVYCVVEHCLQDVGKPHFGFSMCCEWCYPWRNSLLCTFPWRKALFSVFMLSLLRDKPPACDVFRCIKAVFRFPFLQVFPQGVFCGFRNFHQKSFNLFFFWLCATSAHGLFPPVNRPRLSRRGQRVLPAW